MSSHQEKYIAEEWPCVSLLKNKETIRILADFMDIDERLLYRENRHHPFSVSVSRNINSVIKETVKTKNGHCCFILNNLSGVFETFGYSFNDKSIRQKLLRLKEELFCENYYVVPEVAHELFNTLFFGNSQIGSILKLDWTFYEKRAFSGENKRHLMDFLFLISVSYKNNVFSSQEIYRLKLIRDSDKEMLNVNLLDMMKIRLEDVLSFLEEYFFHPFWGRERYFKHFVILFFCRSLKDINDRELELCLKYYQHNGIDRIVPKINDNGEENMNSNLIHLVFSILQKDGKVLKDV